MDMKMPPSKAEKEPKTWNSPTVRLAVVCMQTLLIFLVFAVTDFNGGWVLLGTCWICAVPTQMLNSSMNNQKSLPSSTENHRRPEPLFSLFRTWKHLWVLVACYTLVSIKQFCSAAYFPCWKTFLWPCCSCGSRSFISNLHCIFSAICSCSVCSGLFICSLALFFMCNAIWYSNPVYLLSFCWAKSINVL